MFLERVPIHPMVGRTASNFLAAYGIPENRLKAVFDLRDNRTFRDAILAKTGARQIDPSADLVQMDPARATGGSKIVLPIGDMYVVATRIAPVFDPTGLRAQAVQGGTVVDGRIVGGKILNQEFLNLCTHGIDVRLERKSPDGWNTLPCKRIRWLQTVKKVNNPHAGLSEFVDRHGINAGEEVPWYNGVVDPDPLFMTDKPCGPEAPAVGKGLQFTATTSLVVWTVRRVTLIASYTWGMTIGPGPSVKAIRPLPMFHRATSTEINAHLNILRAGLTQDREPSGSNLSYRATPGPATINDGDLAGASP